MSRRRPRRFRSARTTTPAAGRAVSAAGVLVPLPEVAHEYPAVPVPQHAAAMAGGYAEHHTGPFLAVTGSPAPEPEPPCRCDYHKYGQRPGTGVVLYAGDDAVWLRFGQDIRDGWYEDIHAYVRKARRSIHEELDETAVGVRRAIAFAMHQVEAERRREGQAA
jgi:hypothetical protein